MYTNNKLLIAKDGEDEFYIIPKMANRHGIIAGGTGSGKTVTLKVLAESFSDMGVPVFLADVKGDLAGTCLEGENTDDMKNRIEKFGLTKYSFDYKKYPVEFYDIDRKNGIPVRTTVTEFGPVLFSHILSLNQVQSDLLSVVFKIADDQGLLLLDLKDLKKVLQYVIDNSKELSTEYGNISKVSIQSISRALIALEREGLENLFGEPDLKISDFLKTDSNGQGFINILDSQTLMLKPRVYSAFMLWLLSELYEEMPEVGDLDKPKIVFFFDEAHLLFNETSKALIKKIDQMAKLIRSKGIGLYFITQDPNDIPDTILQQLSNKIQHVYRAYTLKDKRNLKAIAESFRDNPSLDLEEILGNLGKGEAIISLLDESGVPNIVRRVNILPPQSKMGTIDDDTRDNVIKSSLLYNKYYKDIDRESAYEILTRELEERMTNIREEVREVPKQKNTKTIESSTSKAIKNVLKSSGSSIGREIGRSLASGVFGKNTYAKNVAGNIGSSLLRNVLGTLTK